MLFVDFSKAFDSVHREKVAKILKAYGVPTETINAIVSLCKNTKALVRSPDSDTAPFEICVAPFFFILRASMDKRKELD